MDKYTQKVSNTNRLTIYVSKLLIHYYISSVCIVSSQYRHYLISIQVELITLHS